VEGDAGPVIKGLHVGNYPHEERRWRGTLERGKVRGGSPGQKDVKSRSNPTRVSIVEQHNWVVKERCTPSVRVSPKNVRQEGTGPKWPLILIGP